MALATRPTPQPEPPSTTTTTTPTTTTTTTTRPIYPRPSPPPPHTLPHPHLYQPHPTRLPSNYHPQQLTPYPHNTTTNNVVYPLASSGSGAASPAPAPGSARGFLPKQPPVAIPNSSNPNPNSNFNSNLYSARPGVAFQQRPQFAYGRGQLDPGPGSGPALPGQAGQLGQGFGFIRPPAHLQHALVASSSAGVVKGVPVSKIGLNQTTIPDSNGYKDVRDRIRDDSFVIIRDRKVRMSENASLYALCRSWLRNGFPEETQPHYIDVAKSLPRPLPLAVEDRQSPGKGEDDKEEEAEGFVEHLSPQELLQRHVMRAKRVRSRLREERLRRIDRYKIRLGLLIPPMVEQHFRNDSTAGNGNTS